MKARRVYSASYDLATNPDGTLDGTMTTSDPDTLVYWPDRDVSAIKVHRRFLSRRQAAKSIGHIGEPTIEHNYFCEVRIDGVLVERWEDG